MSKHKELEKEEHDALSEDKRRFGAIVVRTQEAMASLKIRMLSDPHNRGLQSQYYRTKDEWQLALKKLQEAKAALSGTVIKGYRYSVDSMSHHFAQITRERFGEAAVQSIWEEAQARCASELGMEEPDE